MFFSFVFAGMTEEEADKLFHEEGKKFDEFIKLKRKNILEGLAFDMESERDRLRRELQNSRSK